MPAAPPFCLPPSPSMPRSDRSRAGQLAAGIQRLDAGRGDSTPPRRPAGLRGEPPRKAKGAPRAGALAAGRGRPPGVRFVASCPLPPCPPGYGRGVAEPAAPSGTLLGAGRAARASLGPAEHSPTCPRPARRSLRCGARSRRPAAQGAVAPARPRLRRAARRSGLSGGRLGTCQLP